MAVPHNRNMEWMLLLLLVLPLVSLGMEVLEKPAPRRTELEKPPAE